MDPHEQEPQLGLPPVKPEGGAGLEQSPKAGAQEAATSQALEQGATGSPAPAGAVKGQMPKVATTPPSTDSAAIDAQAAAIASTMPAIADDTDLIEKEWVDKAKAIVEQTAHDPHLQNQEINKVKVDYLKKRYNKDVKLTND